ncbi:hypothetical protein PVK06_019397 [Gossypium arboreum]|uniref:CCHC-type domain-containing protein n=1 Tax=Gossypium arboreum TaxID=29729 RepID=A0ABR0PJX6_GOSAR|nr:hypothetical protein PVK06_019397 [Gossypium arboreum]
MLNSQIFSNNRKGDSHPDGDRNTKKVRFKETVVDEDSFMAVDLEQQLTMSWKDKLLGGHDVVSNSVSVVPSVGNDNDFELLEGDIIEAIRGLIGKVVKLDVQTDNQIRGRFAGLTVYINLDRLLISQVFVDEVTQRVEYEALPTVCFVCGKYGHVKEMCTLVVSNQNTIGLANTTNKSSNELTVVMRSLLARNLDRENSTLGSRGKGSDFGPWMLVERKSSKRGKRESMTEIWVKHNKLYPGSRFSALLEEKDMGVESGQSARGFLGTDFGVKEADKSRSKIFRDFINVENSPVEPDQGNLKDLDFSKGPVLKENSGKNGKEKLGQKFEVSLDKSLGKRPMGLSGVVENKVEADNIIAKLVFQYSHRVKAIGFSRGIWLGWKDVIRLEVVHSHPQFILSRVWYLSSLHPIFIAYVYGSPNRQKRQFLWSELRKSIPLGQSPWIAIRDFNVILSSSKKSGGLSRGKRCPHFGYFVASAELHDLGFRGPLFTWHRGSLFKRLDRAWVMKPGFVIFIIAWLHTFQRLS